MLKLAGKAKRTSKTPEARRYRRRLFFRKLLLHIVLIVSFFYIFTRNLELYGNNYRARLKPQISRAVIQVAQLIPQLEESEAALRMVCEQMKDSWDRISRDGIIDEADYYIPDSEEKLELFVSATLSWMDRVTKMKVGRDGGVVVLSRDTMTVVAHPNEELIGIQLDPDESYAEDYIIDLKSVTPDTNLDDLDSKFNIFELLDLKDDDLFSLPDLDAYLSQSMYGCMMEYDDYYIICGISLYERIAFLSNALVATVILFIMIWLIIRWISLVLDGRTETARSLRIKLISYSLLVSIITFSVSWYFQTLSVVAEELKTMTHHAEVAVEMMDTYQSQSELMGAWMDSFYDIQCRLASRIITGRKRYALMREDAQPITREDMQLFADYLNVKYVFLFDRGGKVVVTNSNYDHLRVGNEPGEPFYDFRVLLEGVDSVLLPPMKDERYREYIQYVGVSIRDENDLCDGFVMIGVDPALRDALLDAFTIDAVLDNMVIGLPDYALAVDKDTLQVQAATGLGHKGQSIEELGISRSNLEQNFSGFININDQEYYAGVSAAKDQYLIPVMHRTFNSGGFRSSWSLALAALQVLLIIILLTVFRYQKDVIDAAPAEEAVSGPEEELHIDDEEDPRSLGLLSSISERIRGQNKAGFEDRWNVSSSKGSKTPEQRVMQIIYRLLLLFCLFILLPTLTVGMNTNSQFGKLNNLAYVISGKWEKGANIFAFTACILLLCAMYVVSVLLDILLYQIARISDLRVETVCLLIRNAMKYILVVIFVYYGLAQFGVDTQTLLASAGILSLMIGMGAKDLVGDILAGFFIIFEGTYKVGDFITVGGWKGVVTEIGLRTTKVKLGTDIKIFSNSSMRDIVNTESIVRVAVQMPVSYDADITEIERILSEELPLLGPEVIPGIVKPPRYDGVSSFEDSSVMIQIVLYAEISSRASVLRKFNREIKIIFDRRGIEIPYNQLVVHEVRSDAEAKSDADSTPGREAATGTEETD